MAQLDVLGGGQSENCDRYFDTFDISVPRFNLRISMFVVHAAELRYACQMSKY